MTRTRTRMNMSGFKRTPGKLRQLRKPRHTYPPNPVLAAAELELLAPALLTRQNANPVHNTSIIRARVGDAHSMAGLKHAVL
jgi:hypothetical protein